MSRIQLVLITAALAVMATVVCLLGVGAPSHPTAQKAHSVTIIVDRTVDDRNALFSEVERSLDSLVDDVVKDGSAYLGSTIKLVYADNAGEHSSAWQVSLPSTLGVKKAHLRSALNKLNEYKLATLDGLRKDQTHYKQSLLLEAVSRELNSLKKTDTLFIISDMCVVDNSGNNFERLIFADPPRLPRTAAVDIHRIGRTNQSLEAIGLIEAWWADALHGSSLFSPLAVAYRAKAVKATATKATAAKVTVRLKPKALGMNGKKKHQKPPTSLPKDRIGDKYGSRHVTPNGGVAEAPPSIWLSNERKIIKMSATIRPCFHRLPIGRYTFRIEVTQFGALSAMSARDEAPKRVTACFRNTLSGVSFVRHPESRAYYFDETINVGVPKEG